MSQSLNASFASERMMRMKFSQFRRVISSNISHSLRNVAMSIIMLFSATWTQMQTCWFGYVSIRKSPITEADVDFLASTTFGDDSPNNLLLTSHGLDQSSCWFAITLPVLWRTIIHCPLRVLKHLSCGFNLNFYWKLSSNASAISNAVRWLVQPPWNHKPRFARCT